MYAFASRFRPKFTHQFRSTSAAEQRTAPLASVPHRMRRAARRMAAFICSSSATLEAARVADAEYDEDEVERISVGDRWSLLGLMYGSRNVAVPYTRRADQNRVHPSLCDLKCLLHRPGLGRRWMHTGF